MAGTTPERILKRISSIVSLRSGGSKNQNDSERGSVLVSRSLPTKRDAYEITVISEIDILGSPGSVFQCNQYLITPKEKQ